MMAPSWKLLTAPGPGRSMLRLLLPVAILAPLAVDWLFNRGKTGGALGTVTLMVIFSAAALALARFVQRRAEAERAVTASLKESQERLALAQRLGGIGAFDWHASEGGVVWTPELEQLYGLVSGTFPGTYEGWSSAVHPEDLPEAEASVQKAIDEHDDWRAEFRIIRPDGAVRWIGGAGRPVYDEEGTFVRFVGVNMDITARRESEAALRASEEALAAIVDCSPAAIVAVDREGLVTMWNPAAEGMFGWTSDEVVGRPVPFVPEKGRETLDGEVARILAGETIVGLEMKRLRKDGSSIDASVSRAPLRDPDGRVVGAMGLITDISDRKRAEQALRDAEEEYRTLVEQISAITYVDALEPLGRPVYVSPQTEELLGVTVEQWMQADHETWLGFVHPDDRERVRAAYEELARNGGILEIDFRVISRPGEVRWFRDRASLVSNNHGPTIHGVMFDVTESRRAQAELEQSLTLVREGDDVRRKLLQALVNAQEDERRRIASDVHDESVQTMTALSLRVGLLKDRLGDPELAVEVERIESLAGKSVERLRRLIFELRPPALDRDGLAAAIRNYLDETSFGHGVERVLRNRLEREPSPAIRIAAFRIAQEALTNVTKHASARRIVLELENEGGGVLVRVVDDGRGFAAEDHAPLPGHLGLEGMRERAELLGGWCRIESAIGEGTRVAFWLPEADTESAEAGE